MKIKFLKNILYKIIIMLFMNKIFILFLIFNNDFYFLVYYRFCMYLLHQFLKDWRKLKFNAV